MDERPIGRNLPCPPSLPPHHPSSMHLRILHRTTFTYAGKAHDSFNEVRLRPVDDATQHCREFKLRTTPGTVPREYDDFYGNTVHYFEVADPHSKLIIESHSTIETVP